MLKTSNWLKALGLVLLGAFALAFVGCDNPVQTWDGAAEARSVTLGTAAITDVTINGTRGTALTSSVVITLDTDYFRVGTGTVVSGWFTNLPQGLNASIASMTGNQTATITVSGTPQVVSSFYIRGTIPGSALRSGQDLPITVNSNAVYDIRWPYGNWTQSINPPLLDGAVNASAYGDGVFVVGNRNNGSAAFSTDGGATWTATKVWSGSNHISYLIYLNGAFYAAGNGGSLSVSTSDLTVPWNLIGNGLLNGEDIRTIAYGNGITIIAGTGGQAAYTQGYPDTSSVWNPIKSFSSFTSNFNSIAFGEDTKGTPLFVISGQNALTGYSYDGITWEDTTDQTKVIFPATGSQSSIKMVAYDEAHHKFVVVGFHEAAYMVPDGTNFTWVGVDLSDIMGTTSRTSWLNAVTFGGGYFVAGGSEGQSISSTDGINWAVTGAQSEFPPPTTDIPFVNTIVYSGPLGVYLISGGMDNGPGIAVYNN
jgi:hypothetical protein